jgi:hypothetical protein
VLGVGAVGTVGDPSVVKPTAPSVLEHWAPSVIHLCWSSERPRCRSSGRCRCWSRERHVGVGGVEPTVVGALYVRVVGVGAVGAVPVGDGIIGIEASAVVLGWWEPYLLDQWALCPLLME